MSGRSVFIGFMMACLMIVGGALAQSSEQFTGVMGDTEPDFFVNFQLSAGATATITAEAQSGNLDTYLFLYNANDELVAENDDIAPGNLDSRIDYTSAQGGAYYVVLSNWPDTSGEYLLTLTISGGTGDTGGTGVQAQSAPADPVVVEGEVIVHDGFVADNTPDGQYSVTLTAGAGLIMLAEAQSGDLDTIVVLLDTAGNQVAYNDDRAEDDFDSEAYYISASGGTYDVIVTHWGGTSGDYRLTLTITDADSVNDVARIQLSGPRQTVETENFIVHYTTQGRDATTEAYAQEAARILELSYDVHVNQMGWAAPKPDFGVGGDERYDVYIIDLLGTQDGTLGYVRPEFPLGNNPNLPTQQTGAVASFMVIDNAYNMGTGAAETERLKNATLAHEFHHMIQFGYTFEQPMGWIAEATSVYIETVTIPPFQDATDYVTNNFSNPEICFGAVGDADISGYDILMYGTWLFIDSIVREHGDRVLIDIWEYMIEYDSWMPLELALGNYGDTIEDAVALHHIRNLVRDYELADLFVEQNTVWLENAIGTLGNWTFTGNGIQELAANYYEVLLDPVGVYDFNVVGGNGNILLYGVGVRGDQADVFELGTGGTMDTSAYNYAHIVAFNADYGLSSAECNYVDYQISVTTGTGTPASVAYTLDASKFLPLR